MLIVAEAALVAHDASIVPNVFVGEMKYSYPDNPAESAPADQLRLKLAVTVAPLAGLMSVGIGVTVSNRTKNVPDMITQLLLCMLTKISFGPSAHANIGLCVVGVVKFQVLGLTVIPPEIVYSVGSFAHI